MKKEFMLRAIVLSRQNMQAGAGGPFGAVIVKDGKINGEGWKKNTSSNDIKGQAVQDLMDTDLIFMDNVTALVKKVKTTLVNK